MYIQGAVALAEALPLYGRLQELDMSMNFLQGEGASAIATALAANPGLKKLQLNSCYIRSDGGIAIGDNLVFSLFLVNQHESICTV